MTAANQTLPSKEQSLFKSILKYYDTKQNKKALKACNQILKKFPEHGETLCLKGISQWQNVDEMTKNRHILKENKEAEISIEEEKKLKDEAFEFVKNGLRRNVKSYVCWHVFGIIQKNRGALPEAVKAYQNALRFQPKNIQILRDTAVLQIQIRDIEGLIKTRQQMLSLSSNNKSNWIGFCVAHFLAKNYKMCLAVADSYLSTLASKPTDDPTAKYERSEIVLFKARVFLEAGDSAKCLEYLNDSETQAMITDSASIQETCAQIYLSQKKFKEATELFEKLILNNPHSNEYHAGFIVAFLGKNNVDASYLLDVGNSHQLEIQHLALNALSTNPACSKLVKKYEIWWKEHPKSSAIQSILLHLLESGKFVSFSRDVLEKGFKKGVPVLFDSFKVLYKFKNLQADHESFDENLDIIVSKTSTFSKIAAEDLKKSRLVVKMKLAAISEVLESILENLKKDLKFPESDDKQTVDVLVWAKYFYAQHLYYAVGFDSALRQIDSLIAECPTLLQLYLFKAEMLEAQGMLIEAADTLNDGRKLDLQDRFINTKCTRGLIRCFLITQPIARRVLYSNEIYKKLHLEGAVAQDIISLFAKHDGDERTNLNQMQCFWYARSIAKACTPMFWSRVFKFLQFKSNPNDSGEILIKSLKGGYIESVSVQLKHLSEIIAYFQQFIDDQHDFHSYCLRRGTLNAYVDFLKHEDTVRKHPYFVEAAVMKIRLLLFVEDNQVLFRREEDDLEDLQNKLSDDSLKGPERKEIKQQINNLKRAIKDRVNVLPEVSDLISKKKPRKSRRKRTLAADHDPDGLQELMVAKKEVKKSTNDIFEVLKEVGEGFHVHLTACELAARNGKVLEAVSQLLKAKSCCSDSTLNAEVFYFAVWLLNGLETNKLKIFPMQTLTDVKMPTSREIIVKERIREIAKESLKSLLGNPKDSKDAVLSYSKLAENLEVSIEKKAYNFVHLSKAKHVVGEATTGDVFTAGIELLASFPAKEKVSLAKIHAAFLQLFLSIGVDFTSLQTLVEESQKKFEFFSLFHFY